MTTLETVYSQHQTTEDEHDWFSKHVSRSKNTILKINKHLKYSFLINIKCIEHDFI